MHPYVLCFDGHMVCTQLQTGMQEGTTAEVRCFGMDKLLRAHIVLARIWSEAPLHLSIEEKCVLVKFKPGKNTLKDGLDEETLLFYSRDLAEIYYETILEYIHHVYKLSRTECGSLS
jgi:hypothetical protein